MNKVKLRLTHLTGSPYAAMIIDRVQCASFVNFNSLQVSHAVGDDFVFAVNLGKAIIYCHEIDIRHPINKEMCFFGLGASVGEVNQVIRAWLSLFMEDCE